MAFASLRCSGGNAFISRFNFGSDQKQQQQKQAQIFCSSRRYSPQAVLQTDSVPSRFSSSGNNPWKLPPMAPVVHESVDFCREEGKGEITSETLDVWMKDSVTEIVKNIREAPFLVHVFASTKNGKPRVTFLNREKAKADEWSSIKKRWAERDERGECSTPDGVIIVEELKDENEEKESSNGRVEESRTRSWGIVIQGKGMNCGPACYLLKTSRAGSPSIGFCTHYCLVKAQLQGDTPLQQMKNCWLLNPHQLYQHTYFF